MGKFKKAHSNGKGLSHPAVKVLALLNIILLGVGLYIYFRDQSQDNGLFPIAKERVSPYQDSAGSDRDSISLVNELVVAESDNDNNTNTEKPTLVREPEQERTRSSITVKNNPPPEKKIIASEDQHASPLVIQATNNRSATRYTVAKGQAHFHNQPDPSTRRKAFINHWNKAVLQPLDEQNGFIYIVYTNHLGQTSKGWLQIQDLKPLPDK